MAQETDGNRSCRKDITTLVPGQQQFKADTRAEVVQLADDWWKAQNGLTETLRLIFPGDQKLALGKPCCWRVVIHYRGIGA